MVKKLRLKITAITVLSLLVVLSVVGGVILFGIGMNFNTNTSNTLKYIAENNGSFPSFDKDSSGPKDNADAKEPPDSDYTSDFGFGLKVTAETAYETRYFTVHLDDKGEVIFTDISHIAEVSADDAQSLGRVVNMLGRRSGMIKQYRYLSHETESGVREIIFLNCTSALRWLHFAFSVCVATVFFVLVITSLLVWLLSKKIVETFYVNLENQKKFITNASHEIKTPIAIIDANAEVLKYTTGDNEWISSIQNQTKRLTKLVKRLVALSKTEESSIAVHFEKFSVSDAVCDTAYSFKSSAESRGLSYSTDVEHGVYMKGDEGSVRQLVEILLENAVKYCSDGGEIRIRLYTKGRSIYFEVYNDCEGVDTEKLSKLFDRFYRTDDSRSRETGGFGIGLSVAKGVVNMHKGKIYAECENDRSITFVAVF